MVVRRVGKRASWSEIKGRGEERECVRGSRGEDDLELRGRRREEGQDALSGRGDRLCGAAADGTAAVGIRYGVLEQEG